MKKDINKVQPGCQNEKTADNPPENSLMNRRKFVEMTAASAVGFTILPRHVLGGKNYIAPSDKITLAYIGMGTQGIRELLPMLAVPQIQVVAVCDPNKEARGYKDWGKDYLKNEVRKAIKILTGTRAVITSFPVEEKMENQLLIAIMQMCRRTKI